SHGGNSLDTLFIIGSAFLSGFAIVVFSLYLIWDFVLLTACFDKASSTQGPVNGENQGPVGFGNAARDGAQTARAHSSQEALQKIGLLEFDTYRGSDVTDWMNLLGIDPTRSP